jgi:hypothetical protein
MRCGRVLVWARPHVGAVRSPNVLRLQYLVGIVFTVGQTSAEREEKGIPGHCEHRDSAACVVERTGTVAGGATGMPM